jgi:hypothetical protein
LLVLESWLIVVLDLAKKARTVVFAFQSYTTFNVNASSVVNCGLTRDYEFSIAASPGSTQHQVERAKNGWLGIRVMYRVERHVYTWTVVSLNYYNKN